MAGRPGIGVLCTEFVRISAHGLGANFLRQQVVRSRDVALSVQVMGNHLEHMAEATETVATSGADLVDLNVGCPQPRVVRKGVGAAMLKDPELLRRVVSAMRSKTRGFLSAKMRAGFDDSEGAVGVAQLLEASGADLITVHPRRQVDFLGGVSDWRIIAAIRAAVKVPVIGNGDVWYASDALRMRRETGCDGVMIGRGALRNPWIFEQIDALAHGLSAPRPSGNDVLEHFDALHGTFLQHGYARPLGMLKEHARYLCRCVPDGAQLAKRALRSTNIDDLRAALNERLAGEPPEALDLGSEGRLERSGGVAVAG